MGTKEFIKNNFKLQKVDKMDYLTRNEKARYYILTSICLIFGIMAIIYFYLIKESLPLNTGTALAIASLWFLVIAEKYKFYQYKKHIENK